MGKVKTFIKVFCDERARIPQLIFDNLTAAGLLNWMPDACFLKLKYRAVFGRKLDLVNPKTYNEKLQWLKLYDRKPEYTTYVDKLMVRDVVSKRIGPEYLIPLLGSWESPSEIDFEKLPDKFVLKCNHDSGSVVICRDRSQLDKEVVCKKLSGSLKKNLFWWGREWPYKNIKPRIIAEQYLEDRKTNELRDYKFFCFNGKVRALFIATDRQNSSEETKFDFFDEEFTHLPFTNGHPNATVMPEKPVCFEEMKELAAKLSERIPHVRVDFYEVDGRIYFGEMTFFHWSGMVPFKPEEWDRTFGDWIELPQKQTNGKK